MLQITIPAAEMWDSRKREFVYTREQILQLEHSLVSISKWESEWCKSFLFTEKKTYEESIDYIRCMTLTQNVKPEIYNNLTNDNIEQINDYIKAPMTAATFSEDNRPRKNSTEIVTSETIYHWMIALQIPPEYQKWHLNRLIALIRFCEVKNQKPKKKSNADIMAQNRALNAARRKQLNTKG